VKLKRKINLTKEHKKKKRTKRKRITLKKIIPQTEIKGCD